MMHTVLAIDCGTQSLRALLFSENGEVSDSVKVEYEPYFSPSPGWRNRTRKSSGRAWPMPVSA